MSDILFQPLGDPTAAGESLEHVADIDPRLTRTHYFDGRLLTAEDLERDQIYLDQRLREMGKVLGQGIISGLELEFDRFTGLLTLQSGQGMTSAGRVLDLGSQLMVNLGDRALISQFNDGQYRRFNRALYAVVLRYVEVATKSAEVFPTDLAAKIGSNYAMITESVQMGLVPLNTPLPQQNSLHIRAALIREFLGNSQTNVFIPEDSVALGVLAIADDTPQWLDSELLRQPLGQEQETTHLQQNLQRQYEALMEDVRSTRMSSSLNNDFAAKDYFHILPPIGSVPKDAIDPVNGHQGYFPEQFKVSIAPIRKSDVALVKAESLSLPNLDLSDGEAAEIVILAPLNNQDYGYYASQLEQEFEPTHRRLPQLDLLRLKLYPVHPVHRLNTDANVWQAIWDRLETEQLFYVRRPVRAAETAISSVVLALGSTLPAPATPTEPGSEQPTPGEPTTPADEGDLIEDEDSVFLRFVNFESLAKIRPPQNNEGEEALQKIVENLGNNAPQVQLTLAFLLRVERHFDAVIWQTLQGMLEQEALPEVMESLMEAEPDPVASGKRVAELSSEWGLPDELINQWEELVNELG